MTVMTFGKYKNHPMGMLPTHYLMSLYKQKELMQQHPGVSEYIELTYGSLLQPPAPIPDILCDTRKVCYSDEEEAKKALKLIKQDKRTHKKPNRSYQCEYCNYWHLTSKSIQRMTTSKKSNADKVYQKLPYKEWDCETPICLYDVDEYFFDENSLIDYLYDNGLNGGDVQLVLCKPMMYRPIDVETIASDAHEDWRPSKELEERIDQFNDFLTTLPPHSWEPDNIRTSYEYEYKPE